MPVANVAAAWIGFLLGSLSGATLGLFFHRKDWLGGYTSWPRRMLRLGHISFFGIGLINLAFAASVTWIDPDDPLIWPSRLFIAALILMPATCFGAAFWKPTRHLFFLPVVSVVVGAAMVVHAVVTS